MRYTAPRIPHPLRLTAAPPSDNPTSKTILSDVWGKSFSEESEPLGLIPVWVIPASPIQVTGYRLQHARTTKTLHTVEPNYNAPACALLTGFSRSFSSSDARNLHSRTTSLRSRLRHHNKVDVFRPFPAIINARYLPIKCELLSLLILKEISPLNSTFTRDYYTSKSPRNISN
jgi:hypothetical protein